MRSSDWQRISHTLSESNKEKKGQSQGQTPTKLLLQSTRPPFCPSPGGDPPWVVCQSLPSLPEGLTKREDEVSVGRVTSRGDSWKMHVPSRALQLLL